LVKLRQRKFEDFNIGDKFTCTRGRTVTDADITLFCMLSGDWSAIHSDEEFARKTEFKGRIAHGLLSLSISEGFLNESGLFIVEDKEGEDELEEAIVDLGWNNIKYTRPVLVGDTLYFEFEVVNKRVSKSRKGSGIVIVKTVCKNQKGEQVFVGEHVFLVPLKRGTKT
jgi:acyl dehydratase